MAKTGEVRLADVTADNWWDVADLEVTDAQDDFVMENVYSIAESKFDPHAVPKAVYAGKKLVGFVMFRKMADEGRPHEYSIYRLMIDEDHQGKGYGRAALDATLALIREDAKLSRITICYVPKNPVARDFYASFGFREVGIDEDGEMVAEILGTA